MEHNEFAYIVFKLTLHASKFDYTLRVSKFIIYYYHFDDGIQYGISTSTHIDRAHIYEIKLPTICILCQHHMRRYSSANCDRQQKAASHVCEREIAHWLHVDMSAAGELLLEIFNFPFIFFSNDKYCTISRNFASHGLLLSLTLFVIRFQFCVSFAVLLWTHPIHSFPVCCRQRWLLPVW